MVDRFEARHLTHLLAQREHEEAKGFMTGVKWTTLLTVARRAKTLLAMDNVMYCDVDEVNYLYVIYPWMIEHAGECKPQVVVMGATGKCNPADAHTLYMSDPETLLDFLRAAGIQGVYSTRNSQMFEVSQYCLEVAPMLFPA